MLGLKVIASLLSLAEHISRCIWPSQRPGKKQSKSTKPNPPMDNARRGIRFYVNHPYQGRYDSINLVDAKSGLSLLFVIDGGSAYEVHQLVAAALRGEPINRLPTAVLDPKAHPSSAPDQWY